MQCGVVFPPLTNDAPILQIPKLTLNGLKTEPEQELSLNLR